MMKGPQFPGLVFLGTSLIACAPCVTASEPVEKRSRALNESQTALVNRIFASRLLEIASEYKRYERVDQAIRWAPTLCAAPPPRLPKELAAISTSDSKATHGRKLYYLYARKPQDYKNNVSGMRRKNDAAAARAPLGQVLVKEAWDPVEAPLGDEPANAEKPTTAAGAYATVGEHKYRAGDRKGLFVMFKNVEGTPGTDRGWVYGTVSADGKQITSVGLVNTCIQCHRDAPYDRQFGFVRTPQKQPALETVPSRTR